jgi:hypothetical protein
MKTNVSRQIPFRLAALLGLILFAAAALLPAAYAAAGAQTEMCDTDEDDTVTRGIHHVTVTNYYQEAYASIDIISDFSASSTVGFWFDITYLQLLPEITGSIGNYQGYGLSVSGSTTAYIEDEVYGANTVELCPSVFATGWRNPGSGSYHLYPQSNPPPGGYWQVASWGQAGKGSMAYGPPYYCSLGATVTSQTEEVTCEVGNDCNYMPTCDSGSHPDATQCCCARNPDIKFELQH